MPWSRSPRHHRRQRSYSSSSRSRSRSRSRSPLRGHPKYGKKSTRRRSYSRSPPSTKDYACIVSYTSSSSSRSRSRSRSPVRGHRRYHPHKTSRGRSHSRSPPKKDRGSSYKSFSSKQRGSRRSCTPEKSHYSGSTNKARSRSRSPSHQNERYRSPKRSHPQGGQEVSGQQKKTGNYEQNERAGSSSVTQKGTSQLQQNNKISKSKGPLLLPGHKVNREECGNGARTKDQLTLTSHDDKTSDRGSSQPGGSQFMFAHSLASERSSTRDRWKENDKKKYEAVSPDDLCFSSDDLPKAGYYQIQEDSQMESSGEGHKLAVPAESHELVVPAVSHKLGVPAESLNAKMVPPPIIKPIFDPYLVKIPRSKDEGLKEIFDRPELKGRFSQEQLPPFEAQNFIERLEPLIFGCEPRQDTFLDPIHSNPKYTPRDGLMDLGSKYAVQPSTSQVKPLNQEVQPQQDFNRPDLFIQDISPVMQDMPQSPVGNCNLLDDLPDINGQHDIRHNLDSRRKQTEKQEQQGQMRSLSLFQSQSRSRKISKMSRRHSSSSSRSSSSSGSHSSSRSRSGSRSCSRSSFSSSSSSRSSSSSSSRSSSSNMSQTSRKDSSSRYISRSRSRSRSSRGRRMSREHSISSSKSRSSKTSLISREHSSSRSHSRSSSSRKSRKHSCSPEHQDKMSLDMYRCTRSCSQDRSDDHSRECGLVQEKLGDISKGSKDCSSIEGNGGKNSNRWIKERTFYHPYLVDDRCKSINRNSVDCDGKHRGAMRGICRGGRGRGRGQGYRGGNIYIPGYNRGLDWRDDRCKSPNQEDCFKSPDQGDRSKSPDGNSVEYEGHKDLASTYRGGMRGTYHGGRGQGYLGSDPGNNRGYNRGMRGRYNPRGGRGLFGSSKGGTNLTSTHGLLNKEEEKNEKGKGKKGTKVPKKVKKKKTEKQKARAQRKRMRVKARKLAQQFPPAIQARKAKQANKKAANKTEKVAKKVEKVQQKGKNVKKNPVAPESGQAGMPNQCNNITQTFNNIKILPLGIVPVPGMAPGMMVPIPNVLANSIPNQSQVVPMNNAKGIFNPPFIFNPLSLLNVLLR